MVGSSLSPRPAIRVVGENREKIIFCVGRTFRWPKSMSKVNDLNMSLTKANVHRLSYSFWKVRHDRFLVFSADMVLKRLPLKEALNI